MAGDTGFPSSIENKIGLGARIGLLTCGMFTTIGLFAPGLVLPQMARSFAGTPHAALLVQMAGLVASFSFALAAPVAGGLIARYGSRRVILPCLLLFAALGVAPAWLDDLGSIVAARAGLGIVLAGVYTGALVAIGQMPERERARMFGFMAVVGGGVAMLLFPLAGILGQYGWRLSFIVNLVALPALIAAAFIPPALGRRSQAPGRRSADRGAAMSFAPPGLMVVAALVGLTMAALPMFGPIHLAAEGITDTRILAIPVTLGAIMSVAASLFYGVIADRHGRDRVNLLCLCGLAATLVAAGTIPGLAFFTVAVVLNSIMTGLVVPNINAMACATDDPDRAARILGLANGLMFGVQLLFPFLAVLIQQRHGTGAVFVVLGVAAGVVAAGFAISRPKTIATHAG